MTAYHRAMDVVQLQKSHRQQQAGLHAVYPQAGLLGLTQSYNQLKTTATCIEDVAIWLTTHKQQLLEAVLWLDQKAGLVRPDAVVATCALETITIDAALDCPFSAEQSLFTCLNVQTYSSFEVDISTALIYLGGHPCVKTYITYDKHSWVNTDFNATLFASDWPFIAARNLQYLVQCDRDPDTFNEAKHGLYSMAKMVHQRCDVMPDIRALSKQLLAQHFPALSPDAFWHMAGAGLLADDAPQFAAWLLPYRQAFSQRGCVVLPEDLLATSLDQEQS